MGGESPLTIRYGHRGHPVMWLRRTYLRYTVGLTAAPAAVTHSGFADGGGSRKPYSGVS